MKHRDVVMFKRSIIIITTIMLCVATSAYALHFVPANGCWKLPGRQQFYYNCDGLAEIIAAPGDQIPPLQSHSRTVQFLIPNAQTIEFYHCHNGFWWHKHRHDRYFLCVDY